MLLNSDKNLKAHLAMFGACAMWGLMSPVGKAAMAQGISDWMLITFRVVGAAVLFWATSLLTPSVRHEKVSSRDLLLFFFAGMLATVFNQCCFTVGLSLTSPVNASIITTTSPIVTMLLAAIILHEPITGQKIGGIVCGGLGALLLIYGSTQGAAARQSHIGGDVLCLLAQCSFALYLTLFKRLVQRYSVVTCMKWMFTYASLVCVPFTFNDMVSFNWSLIGWTTWLETAYVVVCATYVAYLLMMYGQHNLRPTIVSMYNYVQPLVACIVSVAGGMGVGSKAGFEKLEALAKKLGGSLGASRTAVEAGFVPYRCQVGMTGITVCPKLYIAVGISGAVQHLAGMSGSGKVVAINSDPKAPIFDYADYGIVGDWEAVVDKLLKEENL